MMYKTVLNIFLTKRICRALLVLALLLKVNSAFTQCHITLFSYYLKNDRFNKNQIINSNCSFKTQVKVLRVLENIEGKFHASFIEKKLKHDLKILPSEIHILGPENFLRSALDKDTSYSFSDIKNLPASFGFNNFNDITATTNQENLGFAQIKLTTHLKNKKVLSWPTANMKKKIQVFHLKNKNTLGVNEISSESLTPKFLVTDHPEYYLQDPKDLEYYQLNANFDFNGPLMLKHFTKKTLVRFGNTVHVELSNNHIKLVLSAKAMGQGGHGDIIKFQNLNSKKYFMAKIIGPSKAMVEL